jgi:hypothetical protein
VAGSLPSVLTGGPPAGHEELVIIERGSYVFTVQLSGGGSRPNPSDARALAILQAAAMGKLGS